MVQHALLIEAAMLLLLACAEPSAPIEPIAFCDGPTRFEWDLAGALNVFPDDHRTVPADTPTGRRIDLTTAGTPFLGTYPQGFVDIFDDLSTLDGWGLSAGMWFQADAALAVLPPVRVVAGGEDWPVDLWTTDEGATLMIAPRRPLPEASEITVVVYTDPADAQCIAPSAHLRALLDPATAVPPPQAERYQAALAALRDDPATVAAMSVFTTQSATRLSRLVANDVAGRSYTFTPGPCADAPGWRQCEWDPLESTCRHASLSIL